MSANSVVVLTNQNELNFSSAAVRADGYYGQTDGLHTISFTLTNFVGRIYLDASLALEPLEADWFPIYLTSGQAYRQFPTTNEPTGSNGVGDTTTEAWTFRANVLWLRVRIDRNYLYHFHDGVYSSAEHGSVDKVLLNL